MKELNLAVLIISTTVLGYASCGIIETVVQTLFTDCTDVKNFLETSYEQISNGPNEPTAANIIVYVYGKNTSDKTGIPLNGSGNALWNNYPGFDTSRPTEIFVHGFFQNTHSPGLVALMDSLIKKGGSNVILIDASQYIGYWYLYASTATEFIGEYLGQELATLVNNGYDKSKIHLIGFSLGAVISGFAGNTFKNITQQSLPWITGLDPAGPCFFNGVPTETLDASDATFVDIIHTNMGIYGTIQQLGHIDFYPNGGSIQPGLNVLPFLSHGLALQTYAESVGKVTSFPSVACTSWWLFLARGCSQHARTNMGYGVSKAATGKHYLSTNGVSPYNKGNAGIP